MTDVHERHFCRACAQPELTGEALALVKEYLDSLSEEDCVTGGEYTRRLEQCNKCPSLAGGHTCMHCGCLVMVRAKKKEKGCPHPEGSRWQRSDPHE